MAAYHTATLGASPLLLLFFQEFIDTIIPDIFQVLNHTHSEMCSVSLIKMLKSFAWKIFAFIAIFHITI